MTLEDRIKHTGEHLLGSLETPPDLPQRIEDRVEQRAHQRRQRAAAGLGAGVVVVLGGLVVLNLPGRSAHGPTTAAGGAPASAITLMATTTLTLAPTTSVGTTVTVDDSPPATDPITAPPEALEVTPTVVAPQGDGAPMLYTLTGDGVPMAIDLSTGQAVSTGQTGTGPLPAEGAPPSGATFTLTPATPDNQDRCSQSPVRATDPSGTPIPGFPAAASSLTLSRDGTTGIIRSAVCPDPGTLGADGPATTTFTAQDAWFRTDDPAATLHPIDARIVELSDDGRYLLLEGAGGEPIGVLDTSDGTRAALLPAGCESPIADPATGFLQGADGVAAVAVCDTRVALVGGPVGTPAVLHYLEGCGTEAGLAVLDPTQSSPELNWFAVTDTQARLAWVATPSKTAGPIPVGDRVAWHPLT